MGGYMKPVAAAQTPQLQLITIDNRKEDSHGSCKIHPPATLAPTKRHTYRMIALASVHAYIAFHLISWHVFGIQIWGKTAMMGVQGSMSEMSYEQQRMLLGLLGAGAQYGIILPFSRDHESEADYMGTLYMAQAGYDPHEAIGLWERMGEAAEGPQPSEFASTHPSNQTRISQLEQWMPEMMAIYEKSAK